MLKEIPDTEGLYYASDDGRIFKTDGRMLSKSNSHGYDVVRLTINKKRYVRLVHRLIALTFIYNENNHKEVNHVDGNKKNNAVSNLEWCTRQHNIRHAHENGLCSYSKKLDKKDVELIKEKIGKMSSRKIAHMFKVSETTISEIKHGRTWKNV